MTVAVGSSNPAKIRSVQQALEQVVVSSVQLELTGYSVESGVPDQPMQDGETKRGARNRATAAFEAYKAEHNNSEPHLAVGLEGGLEEQEGDLVCMAWMAIYGSRTEEVLSWTKAPDCGESCVVVDDKYSWGLAKTASFVLPPKVTKLIKENGMELGDADDQVFSRIQSKHGSGTVGILSKNLIDRSKYYEHALVLALVPWIRPDVYPIGHSSE